MSSYHDVAKKIFLSKRSNSCFQIFCGEYGILRIQMPFVHKFVNLHKNVTLFGINTRFTISHTLKHLMISF